MILWNLNEQRAERECIVLSRRASEASCGILGATTLDHDRINVVSVLLRADLKNRTSKLAAPYRTCLQPFVYRMRQNNYAH